MAFAMSWVSGLRSPPPYRLACIYTFEYQNIHPMERVGAVRSMHAPSPPARIADSTVITPPMAGSIWRPLHLLDVEEGVLKGAFSFVNWPYVSTQFIIFSPNQCCAEKGAFSRGAAIRATLANGGGHVTLMGLKRQVPLTTSLYIAHCQCVYCAS
jgi:hypothetical protein